MGRIIQWVLPVKRRPICSRIAVWFTRPWTATRWSSRVRRGSRILFAEIARKWKNNMQKGVSQQDDTVKHERLRIEVYDLAAEHWGVTGTLPIKFGFIGMASQIIQPKIYPCWTQCWILVIYMIKIYFLKSVKRANSCQWVYGWSSTSASETRLQIFLWVGSDIFRRIDSSKIPSWIMYGIYGKKTSKTYPSGNFNIAIEHGHWNSELNYQRVSLRWSKSIFWSQSREPTPVNGLWLVINVCKWNKTANLPVSWFRYLQTDWLFKNPIMNHVWNLWKKNI